jgi:hypothetical protein
LKSNEVTTASGRLRSGASDRRPGHFNPEFF